MMEPDMDGAAPPPQTTPDIERYRPYLRVLAGLQVGPHWQAKIDPSDIVQQALLNAHQGLADFRGRSDGELVAWLRQVLVRTMQNVVRDLGRAKRDVGREQSLERAVEESSARLQEWLADGQSSPSMRAERGELLLRMADALGELPAAQRDAVILHYFQGWTVAQIGTHLGRSPSAVAGLVHRGLVALRSRLDAE